VALARDYFRRQNMPAALAADEAYFREVMLLSQPKIKALEELPAYTACFFAEDVAIDPKARDKVMAKGDPKARLGELAGALATADFSNDAALEQALQALAARQGLGIGDYIHPGRLAVAGVVVGPTFYGLLRVLGRERVLRRIARFLATV
jgi:glutamyl-tRNA synthetase